jgi:hypothetical protein
MSRSSGLGEVLALFVELWIAFSRIVMRFRFSSSMYCDVSRKSPPLDSMPAALDS